MPIIFTAIRPIMSTVARPFMTRSVIGYTTKRTFIATKQTRQENETVYVYQEATEEGGPVVNDIFDE